VLILDAMTLATKSEATVGIYPDGLGKVMP
jgi:hypothetical protein